MQRNGIVQAHICGISYTPLQFNDFIVIMPVISSQRNFSSDTSVLRKRKKERCVIIDAADSVLDYIVYFIFNGRF